MRPLAIAVVVAVTALTCGGAGAPGGADETAGDLAFLSIPLTDVRTGEHFTLGGFPGKVTFFLAMAVW